MKAAVIKAPGQIALEDIAPPTPEPGEVLMQVEACAICGTDQRVLKGEKPVDVPIVGHEIVGTVTALGQGVSSVEVGGRYSVHPVIGCGQCPMCLDGSENLCEVGARAIGYQWNGGFAEQLTIPKVGIDAGCLLPVPADMPAGIATLIEPLGCCVNGMRPIPMEKCDRVVIFGGGIIGVLNGLVAKARGARSVTIMDVSQERLDLLKQLGLPFDNFVNSREDDPQEWVKNATNGRGVNAVVVAASVPALVPVAINLVARSGHLSIFAGMPKSDHERNIDLNLIHYRELHVHGANGSSFKDAKQAAEYLMSGKIDGAKLITHSFALSDFHEAVETQGNPAAGALKVVIVP